MNRESLLSRVADFLRPDKLELLSSEDDNDPPLKPLVIEGERADGDETFETVFLVVLLPVLSSDEELILFE